MTDLVERLRECPRNDNRPSNRLRHEAADEIERLRNAITVAGGWFGAVDEINRLRKYLEEIKAAASTNPERDGYFATLADIGLTGSQDR